MHVFYVSYVPKVLYVFLRFPRSLRFLGGDAKRRVMQIPDARFLHVLHNSYVFYASNPVFQTHEQRCTALQLSR